MNMDYKELYEAAREHRFGEIAEEFPKKTNKEINLLVDKEGFSVVDNYCEGISDYLRCLEKHGDL